MPAKIQRWVDLLAALLRRHYPVTFEEIRNDVPAYAFKRDDEQTKRAVQRMFERDKDELRAFGIPLQTITDGAGEVVGYRLPAREFYLPYLSVVLDGQPTDPKRVDRDGYRSLTRLAFESDELKAVVDAAARVTQLGDPRLADHARSALRKLAVDLPVDASLVSESVSEFHAPASVQPEAELFDLLNTALERRKRVTFDYHSMSSGEVTRREAEPLGVFFLSQHWYLAAREVGEEPVKNFRLSRARGLVVNAAAPGTPDFAVPAEFRLREHARSRHAWEIGAGDSVDAVVRFHGSTGAAVAAARLGAEQEGMPDCRRFVIRRLDAFVRWLLPLGAAAEPVSPTSLIDEHRRQVAETRALYEEAS